MLASSIKETFEKLKPEIVKAFSLVVNEQPLDMEDENNEFGFDIDINEKTLTVNQIAQCINYLNNKNGSEYKVLLEDLAKVNPLDLIWHENFNELINSSFNLMLRANKKYKENITAFLQKLLESCKLNNPQKAIEVYEYWVITAENVLTNKEDINEALFKVMAKESIIIIENNYMIEEETMKTIVETFSRVILLWLRLMPNDTFIEWILEQEVIEKWMMHRNIRKYMKVLEDSITSSKQLLVLKNNAALSFIIKLQETFSIHCYSKETVEELFNDSVKALKLHTNENIKEDIIEAMKVLIRYKSIQCNNDIIKLLENESTLNVKTALMSLVSVMIQNKAVNDMNTYRLLRVLVGEYSPEDESKAEFNSCFLELVEAIGTTLIDINNILPDILKVVIERTKENEAGVFLLTKLSKYQEWIKKHYAKPLANYITKEMQKQSEFLSRDIENTFSLLLLSKDFTRHLFNIKYLESTINNYIDTVIKGESTTRIKQLLSIMMYSPTLFIDYNEFDSKRVRELINGMTKVELPYIEDAIHAKLKVIKMMLRNPLNEFVNREHLIINKVSNMLFLLSPEENVVTENTTLIKEISSYKVCSLISEGGLDKGDMEFVDALNTLNDTFDLNACYTAIKKTHKSTEESKNEVMDKNSFNDMLATFPLINWIPRIIKHSNTIFTTKDNESLEQICVKYSRLLLEIAPKIINCLKANCCPIVPLLFGFFYSNGLTLLPINHAILFLLAVKVKDKENDIADLIKTLLEEKLEPLGLIGTSAIYKLLYSNKKLIRFPAKCIQLIS